MKITKSETERIARLARLEFGDEETESLTAEFAQIVGFADAVSSVPATGSDAENGGKGLPALREDCPRTCSSREEMLAAAPSSSDGFLTVPRVVEQGE